MATLYRTRSPEVFLEKSVLKICSKFTGRRTPMPKCDFNAVVKKLAAYFQNTFS